METQKNTDSWSSLHTLLDINVPPEEWHADEIVTEPAVSAPPESVAETLAYSTESLSSFVEVSGKDGEGKRPRFSRFPKITPLEPPQEDPLDLMLNGTPPSTKPGEMFTSKKLEKSEWLPHRGPRREEEPIATPTPPPVRKPITKGRDPWSMIASQVGGIAAAETVVEDAIEEIAERTTTSIAESETPHQQEFVEELPLPWAKQNPDTETPKHGRRTRPSMFEDEPVEAPIETPDVRSFLDAEEPKPLADAAQRLSSLFGDTPSQKESKLQQEHQQQEHQWHGRRQRNSDSQWTTAKENGGTHPTQELGVDKWYTEERKVDDRKAEIPNIREPYPERGQRGSRYAKTEQPRMEKDTQKSRWDATGRYAPTNVSDEDDSNTSDVFNTWDVEEDSKPVERSGRQRSRRMERTAPVERTERSPSQRFREKRNDNVAGESNDDFASAQSGNLEQPHRSIPSWDDAISSIIEANNARHIKRGSDQRRGRGVRS